MDIAGPPGALSLSRRERTGAAWRWKARACLELGCRRVARNLSTAGSSGFMAKRPQRLPLTGWVMRFRSLNRHDAWRAMPQTLVMRGMGILILATCGLAWPDLALTMTLVDSGIICLMFAAVDLLIAASIRYESNLSARKIGLLGALGASCGAVMVALIMLQLLVTIVLVMLWV